MLLAVLLVVCANLLAQNDRKTFDLNGKVTCCVPTAPDYGFVLPSLRAEFSEDGKLIRLNGFDIDKENGSYAVGRDKEGRIVRVGYQVGDGERVNVLAYDAEGRVSEVLIYDVNIDTDAEVLDCRLVRKYDAKGLPVKETYYNEDGSERAAYSYSYVVVDDEGNWTKRLVSEPSQNIGNEEDTRELTTSANGTVSEKAEKTGSQQSVTAGFGNELDQAIASKKAANKTASSKVQDIVLVALFALLFAHSVFELYIKKPKLVKLEAKTPPADWDEAKEIALAERLEDALEQNVTSFASIGCDLKAPTTRQQMVNIKAALQAVADVQPCNPDVVARYNEVLEAMGKSEKRAFGGSKTYLIVGGVVVAIIAILRMCDGEKLQGAFYFLFSFGAYWLGSQRHTYQLMAQELKGSNGKGALTALLGGIFAFMGSGKTYITTYMNEQGRPIAQDEDNSEHVMYPVLGLLLIAAMGMVMPFVGLVNYVRFYIIHR